MELPGTKTHQANTYYWQIVGGKFARRVKEGEGTMRTTKTGRVIYEKYSDSLTGVLNDIQIDKGEFGEQIIVVLIPAPGFNYKINIQKESRFATTLLERLPKLKLGDTVELVPYSFKDDKEKNISGMNIFKGTVKIESAFKEKTPEGWITKGGYPEFPAYWSSLADKRKRIYFIEVDEFLTNEMWNWLGKQTRPNQESPSSQTNEIRPSEPDDDLPF